jgi:hypothetical protein
MRTFFRQSLLAVLAGNALYFFLLPHLPPAVRHQAFRLDLGLALDFWVCLAILGALHFFGRRK